MRSFFITIINDRLFVMADPSKMSGDWPSLYQKTKMESIIERCVNWSQKSIEIDMSLIFSRPIVAVTFELQPNDYEGSEIEQYDDDELVEIALNIYGGPVGIT
tara:strand:- start:5337 stop:5645 length:309 start_codon:yes stop_codon:yes gene_type:complete